MRNSNTVGRERKREGEGDDKFVCVCVVYVRVFGNTYLTCSIRSPFSDQFLCVDACKAKGMNPNYPVFTFDV